MQPKLSTTHEIASRAIRVFLAYHSLDQQWLAHEVGMTTHQLSRRMTGKTPFTTDDLDEVARVLDITVDQLLTDGKVIFIGTENAHDMRESRPHTNYESR